jgi:hypothetical protein
MQARSQIKEVLCLGMRSEGNWKENAVLKGWERCLIDKMVSHCLTPNLGKPRSSGLTPTPLHSTPLTTPHLTSLHLTPRATRITGPPLHCTLHDIAPDLERLNSTEQFPPRQAPHIRCSGLPSRGYKKLEKQPTSPPWPAKHCVNLWILTTLVPLSIHLFARFSVCRFPSLLSYYSFVIIYHRQFVSDLLSLMHSPRPLGYAPQPQLHRQIGYIPDFSRFNVINSFYFVRDITGTPRANPRGL